MDKKCPDCVLQAEKIVLKLKYNFEKFRLESFYGWPVPYIQPQDLAANGFYYTNKADIVKCNFCNVAMYNWEAMDNVEEEHRRLRPTCPFVFGFAFDDIPLVVQQSPLQANPTPTPSVTPEPQRGYDVPPQRMPTEEEARSRINWIPSFFR